MGKPKGVRPDRPSQDLMGLFAAMEKLFLPQEAFKGGEAILGEGESRLTNFLDAFNQQELESIQTWGKPFIKLQQQLREESIQGDPLAKAQRDAALGTTNQLFSTISGGLEGWEKGELPADVERNIMESVRGSGAARGLLESPTEAVNESVRLFGGRDALRSNRIGQAMAFLGGSGGQGFSNVPSGGGFGISSVFDPGAFLSAGFNQQRQLSYGAAGQDAATKNARQDFFLGKGFDFAGGALGGLLGSF